MTAEIFNVDKEMRWYSLGKESNYLNRLAAWRKQYELAKLKAVKQRKFKAQTFVTFSIENEIK